MSTGGGRKTPADPAEQLAREITREALRLPERLRIWVFQWLREDLADAEPKPSKADEINRRMSEALEALQRAVEHLGVEDQRERLALTIKTYDQLPENVRYDWSAKRVRGAFGGSWERAKEIAFTDQVRSTSAMRRVIRRKELGKIQRSTTFDLEAVRSWLAEDPDDRGRAAYDQWQRQRNQDLADEQQRVPSSQSIYQRWQVPWPEIVSATEEERLPKT